MKKSKRIHLALLTAALSSCSRVIIPNEAPVNSLPDSAVTNEAVNWDDYPWVDGLPCCRTNYTSWGNFSYASWRPLPTGSMWHPYFYNYNRGRLYRKQASWVGDYMVTRSGFGSSSKMVSS